MYTNPYEAILGVVVLVVLVIAIIYYLVTTNE